MGQPLNYTTRQVQDVKNGMTRQEFLKKYGDTYRTHNTFYKIQRMSPLSKVEDKPKAEPKFSRNFGSIKQVTQRSLDRANTLFELMDKRVTKANDIPNFRYLATRGMISNNMGRYVVTQVGKNYVEAILDNNKGFCNNCHEVKPVKDFHKSSLRYQGRAGDYCKKCKQKDHNYKSIHKMHKPKVSKAVQIWNSVKKLFPKLVWE